MVAKARKVILVAFLLAIPLFVECAESASLAGPDLEQKITELSKEVSRLKESIKDSVKADLFPFFTLIILGGGLATWVLIYTSLSSTIKDTMERHLRQLMEQAQNEIDVAKWLGDSARENSVGAFWEESYETASEGVPRSTRYLELAFAAYDRALRYMGNLK